MFKQMKWEDVYDLWKTGQPYFPELLSTPVSAETVLIEYKKPGFFYGYDWLENKEAEERKGLIKKELVEFFYFTKPTNKGTIQTAEMLVEAQGAEEQAAIWIAATTKELLDCRAGSGVGRCASALYGTACEFLNKRYYLWHHAMKRLVPEILIPSSVLTAITCTDESTIIGLVQMNTVLLKSNWRILRYSSLYTEEFPPSRIRIPLR